MRVKVSREERWKQGGRRKSKRGGRKDQEAGSKRKKGKRGRSVIRRRRGERRCVEETKGNDVRVGKRSKGRDREI